MNRVTKIVIYTLLIILAFAGVVVFGLLFAVNDYSATYLLGALLALGLVYFSIVRLIDANNAWKLAIKREIQEEGKDVITSWEIGEEDWSLYLAEQKASIKSITITSIIVAGVIVFVLYVFIAKDSEQSLMAIIFNGLMGAVPLGLLVGGVYGLFQWRTIKKLSRDRTGKVFMAREAIVVNEMVIIFQRKLFQSISSAEIISDRAIPVINLTVKMKSVNRSNYQEHFIPFPVGMEQQAQKIIDFYLSGADAPDLDDQEVAESGE